MSDFNLIINENDLSTDTLSISLSENRMLTVFHPLYDESADARKYVLRNINAIYYLADGNIEMYNIIIELYRKELNILADEATDESTSHLLGSGQDFFAIHRDMVHYLNENIAFKDKVLSSTNEANKDRLENIWNHKIQWYNKAVLLAKHADWITEKFQDNKYHNISGLCQMIYQID